MNKEVNSNKATQHQRALVWGFIIIGFGLIGLFVLFVSTYETDNQQYRKGLSSQEREGISQYKECLHGRLGIYYDPTERLRLGTLTQTDLAETSSNLGCRTTIPAGPRVAGEKERAMDQEVNRNQDTRGQWLSWGAYP